VKDIYNEDYKPLNKETKKTQKMERSLVLMNWQNQYCENGYITKSNLHFQCNSYQNSNDTHHRDWKINPKVHLEKEDWICKTMLSETSNTGGTTISNFKLNYRAIEIKIAQYCPQTDMKPVDQNRRPRYESMQLCPLNIWQTC
jgi:hypothetical protein